jgi:Zn finger protein HypA/HybF involved in hydrogenase expression
MHDTILLSKITEVVVQECKNNNINKVTELVIKVNNNSHVDERNLYEHLQNACGTYIGDWTNIKVQRADIEDQTAILQSIEGEESEG